MSVSDEAQPSGESVDLAVLRARLVEISHDRDDAWGLLKALQARYTALENRSGMPVCTPAEYETLVDERNEARRNAALAREAADTSQIILSEVQARLNASQAVLFETQRERAHLATRWEADLRTREGHAGSAEPEPASAADDATTSLREDYADAVARLAAFDNIRDRLYDTYLRCAAERDEARAALAAAATRAQETSRDLERSHDESTRLKSAVAKLQDHVLRLDATHERHAGLLRHMADAQGVSAATIASLEKKRLQLEFDLTTRVGAADARAARHEGALKELALERAMLIEALRLREERVALLETAVRRIARETIAATEADLERYRAMHQSLMASKLFALRRWVAVCVRARVWPRRSAPKRPQSASLDVAAPAGETRRPRHLRSA